MEIARLSMLAKRIGRIGLPAVVALAGCFPASPAATVPSPTATDAARLRGLLDEDRWPEALAEARAAHAADATNADVAAALAESLFRAGELVECEALLESLSGSDHPLAGVLTTLARLRAAQGRREDVKRLLDRALAIAPERRDVLYWAGDLTSDRGRAIELLERYLAVSEGDDAERIDAAQGAVRFMRQLGDRAVWVAQASPTRVELPLTQVWDASGRTLGYVVEARLAGKRKPVRLLLDTGSHGLFLVDRVARKRQFAPLSDKTLYGGGGDRRHATRRGVIPTFDLGGLRFSNALATTTPSEFDPTGRFHGLLGISIFGGYRVTLDLAAKRLVLEESRGDAPGADYWWISGQMLTRAGAGSGSGLFVLDSGATDTVVADEFLARLDGAAEGTAVTVRSFGGNVGGARLVRGVTVEFQGLQTEGAVLAYDLSLQSRLGGVEVSGLLGLDLLGKQRIVIDTRTQRIAILP